MTDSIDGLANAAITLAINAAQLEEARTWLSRGAPVIFIGPAGVGKSALAHAVAGPGTLVIDPLGPVGSRCASRIRRALDAGRECVSTARFTDSTCIPGTGRIRWRFVPVRVPLRPTLALSGPVGAALRQTFGYMPDSTVVQDVCQAAKGRAAYAAAIVTALARREPPSERGAAAVLIDLLQGR